MTRITRPARKVYDRELELSPGTLNKWRQQYGEKTVDVFPGKGHQGAEDEELRRLRREKEQLRAENDVPKNVSPLLEGSIVKRYQIIAEQRGPTAAARLCKSLGVSRSGYYGWQGRGLNKRAERCTLLRQQIIAAFEQNRRAYGSPRVTAALQLNGVTCDHKPVEAIMREAQLAARPARRRRSTTAVKSAETVAGQNVLARYFTAPAPNTRWSVDMTMLPHARWLAISGRCSGFVLPPNC